MPSVRRHRPSSQAAGAHRWHPPRCCAGGPRPPVCTGGSHRPNWLQACLNLSKMESAKGRRGKRDASCMQLHSADRAQRKEGR